MAINKEIIKYTLKNISHRKTRSLLTIISIFFGITTIFIFISFGLGLYSYVNSFTTESSADKISIMPRSIGAPGLDDTFALTKDDVHAIERASGVYEATGMYSKAVQVTNDDEKKYVFLLGYDPSQPLVLEISNIDIYKGRLLQEGERGGAVFGYNYQFDNKIFSHGLDINDNVELQGQRVKVIGFFSEAGNPQDDSNIYLTNEFFEELYPEQE